MFLDMQESSMVEGMLAFPDYPFANLPRQGPIIEQKFLCGESSSIISLQGSLDDPDDPCCS